MKPRAAIRHVPCLVGVLLIAAVGALGETVTTRSNATGQEGADGAARAGKLDPNLEQLLAAAPAGQPLSTLVFLNDQVDLGAIAAQMDRERATLRCRHETVVRSLQQVAEAAQRDLVARLKELQADGQIERLQPFWIANCIRVDAVREVIEEIATRPDVAMVYLNYEIELIGPTGEGGGSPGGDSRGPTIGLEAIRAPDVWAMGYTGQEVLVATLDTGVDGDHPALASRWRGVADPRYANHPEWAWFDPVTNTTFPQAFGDHGTHTMGTVCGGPPGEQIGVAPGVQWIHAAVIDRLGIDQTVANAILAFQWLLDPDGDPSTNWDVPAVCSNSWGLATWHGYLPCDPTFWTFLDACEAGGIVILFSAGNEGPAAQTIRRPADRATTAHMVCAVGAIDANNPSWPVADLSSRGPSDCTPDGTWTVKPELAAPGVEVYSSVDGGGYESDGWSGTSMASPHVNGVVALIREACPGLGVQEVLQILYDTAYDLGPPGEDNDSGYGMVDAFEAVNMALDMCSGVFIRFPGGLPTLMAPGVPASIAVRITAANEEIVAGTETLHFRYDGGTWLTRPLTPLGGELYEVTLASAACDDTPEYYFSVAGTVSGVVHDPPDAPAEVYTAEVGEVVSVLVENLDADPGWSTEAEWAFGQPTGGGGENGGPDPTSGYTGENVYGYNLEGDYENNLPERHLTSVPIDCTGLSGAHLRFWRWLGVERPWYDHAYVRVSNDGANWTTVWENTGQITDTFWIPMDLDISAVADDQPTVYLRWTMGPTDYGWPYCGWNIDDIELIGLICEYLAGDLDGDGDVDLSDLAALLTAYGRCAGDPGYNPAADLDNSGCVDLPDLATLLANYGAGL